MGKAPQLLLPDSPLMHCKAYSSSKNVFTCGCHAAGPPAHVVLAGKAHNFACAP
jgi:hypothetical protein